METRAGGYDSRLTSHTIGGRKGLREGFLWEVTSELARVPEVTTWAEAQKRGLSIFRQFSLAGGGRCRQAGKETAGCWHSRSAAGPVCSEQ